jgi:ABC-2 family transporter protein
VIRMTLRQLRTQALIGFGLLGLLGVVIIITGIHLAQENDAFLAATKAAGSSVSKLLAAQSPIYRDDLGLSTFLPIVAVVTPLLIGLFVGAPLIASELETGTFRLAWTQSVTRRRWLVIKIGLVGLIVIAGDALLTLLIDWWQLPFDALDQDVFNPLKFGFHGVVPIGYAAFAFALGVTAGVLLRRTVPAMAASLVGFVGARVAATAWLRPLLAAPLHKSVPFLTASPVVSVQSPATSMSLLPPALQIPNGWVYGAQIVDASGRPFTGHLLDVCPALSQILKSGPSAGPPTAVHECLVQLSATYHTLVTYQPAGRFWPFQWAETGIFVAAALALCGLAYWWLRRRYG